MTGIKPMLDDIELDNVQKLEIDDDQVLLEHEVPALEGNFFQGLGRRATSVTLTGVMVGPEVGEKLRTLREKFRGAEPVSFVADIMTATRFEDVLIEEMGVREIAGRPERFEYAFSLREYIEPPVSTSEEPDPVAEDEPESQAEAIDEEQGTLVVEVRVEDRPGYDFSRVALTARGEDGEGAPFSRTLETRENNVWTEPAMPAGDYTLEAVVTEPEPMSGNTAATVTSGQTATAQIALAPGPVIAERMVVHFHFDRGFIEPCMRAVMRQVAARAGNGSSEKLLILGHTDKTGSRDYNQSLAERRARSAFAYLTFGSDRNAALAEWRELRQNRPAGQLPSMRDSWDVREYQHMLQDLGYYPGEIDGNPGPLTNDAVAAFRCRNGLPPGQMVDPPFWDKLIERYLEQDNLAVPVSRFLTNAKGSCDSGIVKWLGCGEDDPIRDQDIAWRPNRRTEFLFVRATALPGNPPDIPEPVTFNLPTPGTVGSTWCLGPGNPAHRCCSLVPHHPPGRCQNQTFQPWQRPPDPPKIRVEITIRREVRQPNGSVVLQPAANQHFVLVTPDGRIFRQEGSSSNDPTPERTDAQGQKSFDEQIVGVYSLEVDRPHLVRLAGAGLDTVRGNTVCKRLTEQDRAIEVVILAVPMLRELRLPVAVHLMTALHPQTRDLRTCPNTLDPANPHPQRTVHTADDVRSFFDDPADGANAIWAQARIRFEVLDIVREAFAINDQCEITASEIAALCAAGGYPNMINMYFFGDLENPNEAGVHVLVPPSGQQDPVEGIGISDRFQLTVFQPPITQPLDRATTVQVIAHELGHYLGLESDTQDHVTPSPANDGRLMLPGTADGSNRRIVEDEHNRARAHNNAHLECMPLSLEVTGAVRIGGPHSHQYMAIQNPGGTVTVDARISEALTAPGVGAVTMTGGDGTQNTSRTVSTGTTGTTHIDAVYTPTGGGRVVRTRVTVFVSTFQLCVRGGPCASGSDTLQHVMILERDPIRLVAQIFPSPLSIPENLVTWQGGQRLPDPLQVSVAPTAPGETTVRAEVAGVTRTVTVTALRVMLDVDADRDGVVERNGQGKNSWAFGAGQKGAVILFNNDNDDRAGGNAEIDSENARVDGPADVDDLAPLVIRASGAIPTGHTLALAVDRPSRIRVFNARTAAATAILGPGPLGAETAIANSATSDLVLGMEATQYPGPGFDGLIRLSLILRRGNIEIGRDEVQVRVAPWLMPSHLNVTQELYVVETPNNGTFRAGVRAAATAAGVPLRAADGNNYLEQVRPGVFSRDIWMQDTMEIGYSRMPAKAFNVVLKSHRFGGLRPFSRNELLGSDYGYVEIASSSRGNTFDSTGNLEVSPPVTVGAEEFKLGRIFFGRGRSATPFNLEVRRFLEAQRIQRPFAIDTDWLAVGHVDEIISFVPTNGVGRGFKMLISDTQAATAILNDLRANGHGSLLLFESTNEEISVQDLLTELADTSFGALGWLNAICQSRLAGVRATMQSELALEDSDILPVPSLFTANRRSPHFVDPALDPVVDALIPGMVNMLVITRPTFARNQLVIAKPFGPKPGRVDPFEQAMRDLLTPLGYATSQIRFVDDYHTYHLALGEVHCGTNSKRSPDPTPWWEQTDV